MDKLAKIMNYLIKSDLYTKIHHRKPEDPEPDLTTGQLMKELYKDVIFSNKSFWDRAEIEQARQHFAEYLCVSKGQGYGLFKGCLIINEQLLKLIITSPLYGFVGMIDGRYPKTRYDLQYAGFIQQLTSKYMWELCPSVPEGLIPVYDAGTGKAYNEEGNVHLITTDQGVWLF
ncbi:uncharacterized protein P174DRAFT_458970 [Aspergillus novofumigatus IBT 16806]|uniref:Uncharacterized protein n=1 Tax=Aspergillus novofumigatus (strain IBT 16806) TaxID=1392255 RepID=A0A2I1CCS9_ASPN1|nr:uncharacterized protein P174DRAFT_458970 [Aspergillus novofumigatus IBT 16806]PKX95430.1 hypothetical protein P174DRAFT_458970 [Aspergillus novofumigatus IBT 16806]